MDYKFDEKKDVNIVYMDSELSKIYKEDVVYMNIIPKKNSYYDILYVVKNKAKVTTKATAKVAKKVVTKKK